MARTITIIALGFCVFLLGCEPLVPEVTQEVVIVTATPTEAPVGVSEGTVPEAPTLLPTFTPIPTPTQVFIPTATVPPCNQETGTVLENTFTSTIADAVLAYNVYLPPCFFQSARRYPYTVLLHDAQSDAQQWIEFGVAQLFDTALSSVPSQDQTETLLEDAAPSAPLSLAPMVVIMPEGGEFKEDDTFVIGATYEDVILLELIPQLERDFCLWTEQRAIGGVGRGGFWAFSIAFRNPDTFRRVGGHSPQFAPENAPNDYNPMALAETAIGIEGLGIYLDNAQSDPNSSNIANVSNTLNNRVINHRYIINASGEQNEIYWQGQLENYLSFYSEGLPLDVAELPSCQ